MTNPTTDIKLSPGQTGTAFAYVTDLNPIKPFLTYCHSLKSFYAKRPITNEIGLKIMNLHIQAISGHKLVI